MWFNFQRKHFDFESVQSIIGRPWKEFSLLLIKYFDLSKGDYNKAMKLVAQGGHRNLVDFFISKGADKWNMGLSGTEGGHRDLVNFFIFKGVKE